MNNQSLASRISAFLFIISLSISTVFLTSCGGGSTENNTTPNQVPNISISSASIVEGHENSTSMEFTIALNEVAEVDITIDYETEDGTAASGVDYTQVSNTLVISQGNTSGVITVAVNGDMVVENDETFTLKLSNISDGTSDLSVIGTIINDDVDSDGDMLSDYAEENLYGTNPTLTDSDGDGVNDNIEITNRTNPVTHINPSAPLYFWDVASFGFTELKVPTACYSITIKAWGAGGGQNWASGGNSSVGGGGGYAESILSVIPGETLELYVGQGGHGSGMSGNAFGGALGGDTEHFGGGGGGSTELRIAGERLVVAGGGGGSGNYSEGNGGPGGGLVGIDGGGTNGGAGGDDTGLTPDGENQTGTGYSAHSGAGGGGYSGGGRGTSYGQGGGGGSSFGDTTTAGSGRAPGNLAEAGSSGFGGVASSYYDDQGPNSSDGSDGRLTLYCTVYSPSVVDSDDDGVLDTYEVSTFATNPALQDSDNDGLTDLAELKIYKTNPVESDTDSDGLDDASEINTHGTNPNINDTDNDGLTDGDEFFLYATDPLNSDSDTDGLSDSSELLTHGTDPNNSDSDGDGLTDNEEINTYATNPNSTDTDSDTLTDYAEVNTHGTNPTLSDSDNDGLSDSSELFTHGTDPNNSDSDGDRINDGDELTVYSTDPNNIDSDGDGFSDGNEIIVKPVIDDGAVPIESVTYSTWGLYEFIVPENCDAVLSEAWGAGGGQNWASGGNSSVGGGGGYAKSLISVSANDVLELYVGQGGHGSGMSGNAFGGALGGDTQHFGGGGGGSTELRIAGERFVVAGGGGGSGNYSEGNGGPGGGLVGIDGGGTYGGTGGSSSGLNPNGVNQTGTGYSAHSGAGGGGYSGGGRGTSYGQGGGGGSSFGDTTTAGSGRAPGNLAEAGNSGFGGVASSYYDDQGPNSYDGSDGKIIVECHVAIGSTGGSDPNDFNSIPDYVFSP